MQALRQIYDCLPSTIEIPKDLRCRHVEVVFLALDESEGSGIAMGNDWPAGLYERTSGAWQGELFREPQGEYEQRLEME